ncbi:hypothetical protein GGU10DRAFT_373242 [Lentinula aff. detonsa]|uniref:DUF6534 domain-containing protein n=1 Tax=Lentinula aff. detonsa TaxID=2804958 RepID=A0AA38KBS7_9AGAR|nr:hypothetical protein GGU10DRAFT_373242 [Lentinula aff. detonsa]
MSTPHPYGTMNASSTFGSLLLGGLVASTLTGILLTQGLLYSKSNTDPSYIRAMVAVILILDMSHSVTLFMGLWTWFIRFRENDGAVFMIPVWVALLAFYKFPLMNGVRSIAVSVVITALTTIIAHAFFAWRIFKLSKKNYWLLFPIAIPAILAFSEHSILPTTSNFSDIPSVFACVSQADMIHLDSFQLFRDRSSWVFTAGLALSSAVDVMITAMMMILLRQSRTKSLSLDAVIDSLFVLTLENGAITSLAALTCMVLWLTMDNFIFLGLYFIIGKLYGNSILAVLNYRKHLSQKRDDGLPRSCQNNIFDLNVVRFSAAPSQPRPARTSFRSSSSRSILNLPSQICHNMKDKTWGVNQPSEKAFQINVERSVELHMDDLGGISRDGSDLIINNVELDRRGLLH